MADFKLLFDFFLNLGSPEEMNCASIVCVSLFAEQ